RFGWAVAIDGDTIVVGARWEDGAAAGVNGDETSDAAPLAGAAYVFVRQGTSWSQQAYLKASNPGHGDEFGYAVGVSGDTIVIGAHDEESSTTGIDSTPDDNAEEAGAAYVFGRVGTTWSQQAYVKASNTASYAEFGDSVAVSGDTIVVGSPSES